MKRLQTAAGESASIFLDLEGEQVPAREGENVAAALLAGGHAVLSRSVKYHRPRGPYCMAGACSQCLMRIDGAPNQFACQTRARPGMRIERQNAYPNVEVDVFAAIDWLFPKGLDHHAMFAGVPVAEAVMAKVARHLAGLGLLPDRSVEQRAKACELRAEVAIVGGGPAGLFAARTLAEAGVPFRLFERDHQMGGRLLGGAPSAEDPAMAPETLAAALPEGTVQLCSMAIGLYDDAGGKFVAVVQSAPEVRLLKVYARRFLLAVGGHPATLPFPNNDLPGIFAGRAASTLIRRHRVLPAERVVIAGHGPELHDLARLCAAHGPVAAVVDAGSPPASAPYPVLQGHIERAHGGGALAAVTVRLFHGGTTKIACDGLFLSLPSSPSFELARQGGASVRFDASSERFVVECNPDGQSAATEVLVAGECCGAQTLPEVVASAKRSAAAIIRSLR